MSLAALSRATHPSPPRHSGWILVATCVIGILITSLGLFTGDPVTRLAQEEARIAASSAEVTRIGTTTLGSSFLSTGTATPTPAVLERFEKALDPLTPGKGLFPLRKMIESLAGMLILPLILYSALHIVLVERANAENRLAKLATNFFLVLIVLYSYPLWDTIIYQGISKPLTARLTNEELTASIIHHVAPGTETGGRSPLELVALQNQNSISSAMSLATARKGDASTYPVCLTDRSTPVVVVRACVREMLDMLPGTTMEKRVAVYQKLEGYAYSRFASQAAIVTGDQSWMREPEVESPGILDQLGRMVSWITDGIGTFITDTIPGMLLVLQMIVMQVVMWFVWLMVLVTRAFSLCIAPIAIIWGLVPNKESRMKDWFGFHAKQCLKPVALALGFLIFLAVQASIMGTNVATGSMGTTALGLGLKLALFVGFVVMCFKIDTLTNAIAGDITRLAADIGSSVTSTAVSFVGTAAKVALPASAAVAGTVGSVASRAGQAAVQTKGGQAAMNTMRSLGERTGMIRKDDGSFSMKEEKEPGRLRRMASGTADLVTGAAVNTKRMAEFVWENRAGIGQTESVAKSAGAAGLKKLYYDDVVEATTGVLERRRSSSAPELGASQVSTKELRALETVQELLDAQAQEAEEQEIQPRLRRGEKLDLDPSNITVFTGMPVRSRARAEALGTQLINLFPAQGREFHVQLAIDEDSHTEVPNLTQASADGLTKEMATNDALYRAVMNMAVRTYGSEANVPMVDGGARPVPDVQALIRNSTEFSVAASAATQMWGQAATHLHDRELLTAFLEDFDEAQEDSIPLRLARMVDDTFGQRRPGETWQGQSRRRWEAGMRMARRIWYLENEGVNPHLLIAAGLPPEGAADQAEVANELDIQMRHTDFLQPGLWHDRMQDPVFRKRVEESLERHREFIKSDEANAPPPGHPPIDIRKAVSEAAAAGDKLDYSEFEGYQSVVDGMHVGIDPATGTLQYEDESPLWIELRRAEVEALGTIEEQQAVFRHLRDQMLADPAFHEEAKGLLKPGQDESSPEFQRAKRKLLVEKLCTEPAYPQIDD